MKKRGQSIIQTNTLIDPAWIAAHTVEVLPEKIAAMHRRYGAYPVGDLTVGPILQESPKRPKEVCGHCVFFVVHQMGGKYFKCSKNRITHGPGTDWRFRFPACGLFQRRTNGARDGTPKG